nr:VCBS repeat-containing protein [Deltaproteobacteria bacterium]
MRGCPTTFVLLAALGCARRMPVAITPPQTPATTVVAVAVDVGAPRRVVRHRSPEAAPPEFAEQTRAEDVDGDGLDDLVRRFPRLPSLGDLSVDFSEMPPVVVAHRLPDGRYALDDEVTRASLRALCPSPPPPTRSIRWNGDSRDGERVAYLEGLFIDGFCHRVWGAPIDQAVASVRASAGAAPEGLFPADSLPAVIAALHAFPVPQELEPLNAPPLLLVRAVPRTEPSLAPPAPSDRRCSAVERANAALLARANRASDRSFGQRGGHLLHQDESLCVATAQGVWAIALEGFRVERGDQEGLLATGLLTWRPNAGRASAGVRIGFRTDGNSGDETMLVPAADYDNDGTPEVIVHRRERDSEAGGHHTRRVFTARGGTLEPYSPAARFLAVDGVVDADRDGRPDLVLESPWGASSRCGYMGETHHGPALLAHALPDGTFSTRDDVTRAWTLSRCVREEGSGDAPPDVIDVACARIRGASSESVIAALQARAPAGHPRAIDEAHAERCLTFHEMAAVALVPLPFDPVREGELRAR